MSSRRERIRRVLTERGEMATLDVAAALGEARRPVNNDLQVMHKKGELDRVGVGIYRLKSLGSTQLRMWRVIRASGPITGEKLAELSDTSLQYAHNYLRTLEAQGVMKSRRVSHQLVYRLVHDTGPIMGVQTMGEMKRLTDWRQIQKAMRAAELAMVKATKLMEAFDAKYGDQTEPDGEQSEPDGDAIG